MGNDFMELRLTKIPFAKAEMLIPNQAEE